MGEVHTQEIGLNGIAVHPDRLRALRPDVVDELAASMRESGLLHPILLLPRSVGGIGYMLVAGRHRLEAARKLKWVSIRAEIRDGLDAVQAELAEIDENLMRAELSAAERDLHRLRRKELHEKLHPETKHGTTGRGREKSRQFGDSIERFTADAAKKTGTSERTIQRSVSRARKLGEDTLRQVVGTSLDKPEQLNALARLKGPEREQVIERALTGARVNVAAEVKKHKRAEREAELAGKITALPDIKFGVIVEDLEWDFQVWSRETGMDRHAANHYPVAEGAHSAAELHERTEDRFACAADDCVLFMWTTVPMLAVAIDLMELRGFRYVSNYVWGKDRPGTGYWSRNRHEILLIGTKGKVVAPAPGTQWDSVILAPVEEHSRKPDIFLEMIESYYPNVPKLELNRRGSARLGWHAWGNEAKSLPKGSTPLAEAGVAEVREA